MDNSNTLTTLIVINLIVNIINVINNFINHLKRSKCLGGEIEMDTEVKVKENNKPSQDNDIDSIKKLIDILNNNKSNNIDNKIDNKSQV